MHKLTVISAVSLCNIINKKRIYGIHNGGNDKVARRSIGTSGYTESDLAYQLGIDINTLKRAKSLTTLPSEIQDLIEQGRFPK